MLDGKLSVIDQALLERLTPAPTANNNINKGI
jgi:hypothetical protein